MNPIVKRLALKLCESAPACVLEILLETLIKTWNDYIREHNLPFRSIDMADLRSITTDQNLPEGERDNTDDPTFDGNSSRVPIGEVDEQMFFDYFREHVEQPNQCLNSNIEEGQPASTSCGRSESEMIISSSLECNNQSYYEQKGTNDYKIQNERCLTEIDALKNDNFSIHEIIDNFEKNFKISDSQAINENDYLCKKPTELPNRKEINEANLDAIVKLKNNSADPYETTVKLKQVFTYSNHKELEHGNSLYDKKIEHDIKINNNKILIKNDLNNLNSTQNKEINNFEDQFTAYILSNLLEMKNTKKTNQSSGDGIAPESEMLTENINSEKPGENEAQEDLLKTHPVKPGVINLTSKHIVPEHETKAKVDEMDTKVEHPNDNAKKNNCHDLYSEINDIYSSEFQTKQENESVHSKQVMFEDDGFLVHDFTEKKDAGLENSFDLKNSKMSVRNENSLMLAEINQINTSKVVSNTDILFQSETVNFEKELPKLQQPFDASLPDDYFPVDFSWESDSFLANIANKCTLVENPNNSIQNSDILAVEKPNNFIQSPDFLAVENTPDLVSQLKSDGNTNISNNNIKEKEHVTDDIIDRKGSMSNAFPKNEEKLDYSETSMNKEICYKAKVNPKNKMDLKELQELVKIPHISPFSPKQKEQSLTPYTNASLNHTRQSNIRSIATLKHIKNKNTQRPNRRKIQQNIPAKSDMKRYRTQKNLLWNTDCLTASGKTLFPGSLVKKSKEQSPKFYIDIDAEETKCDNDMNNSANSDQKFEDFNEQAPKENKVVKYNKKQEYVEISGINDSNIEAESVVNKNKLIIKLPANSRAENKITSELFSKREEHIGKTMHMAYRRKKSMKDHRTMMFGHCSDCTEIQSINPHNSRKMLTKDMHPHVYYKDRRRRSKSRSFEKMNRNGSNLPKKSAKPVRKRVTFVEDQSIFSYDPKESIFESFYNDKMAEKSIEEKNEKVERISVMINVGENTEAKKNDVTDNMSDERTASYMNLAFEDVPTFLCLPDSEVENSVSSIKNFGDEEYLLGEGSSASNTLLKVFPENFSGLRRQSDSSARQWLKNNLFCHKSMSLKKKWKSMMKKK